MLTINKRLAAGAGLAPALVRRAPTVTLDWDLRQKSRFEATDSSGRQLGIFLPRGTQVRGGDVLVADDGSLVRVQAAPQPVMVVTHCREHGSAFDLMRAAYHLGNRHVALALEADRLLLEPDHVLADMLRQMHLIVTEVEAPFEPEGGAYGAHGAHGATGSGHAHAGHDHSHGHGHDHDHGKDASHDHHGGHDHGHGHDPVHAPTPAAPATKVIPVQAAHVHGPGCGHDHNHDQDHGHRH